MLVAIIPQAEDLWAFSLFGKWSDIYITAVYKVPLNKLDSLKTDANIKMDSVVNFYKNNNVITK